MEEGLHNSVWLASSVRMFRDNSRLARRMSGTEDVCPMRGPRYKEKEIKTLFFFSPFPTDFKRFRFLS